MSSLPPLILIGDEAWTPEEFQAHQTFLERRRQRDRERYRNPERRAALFANVRRWRERNPERVRIIHARSALRARFKEGTLLRSVASLHDLRCTGPTRKKGCRCDKTLLCVHVEAEA